jgi:hypothetical protein
MREATDPASMALLSGLTGNIVQLLYLLEMFGLASCDGARAWRLSF